MTNKTADRIRAFLDGYLPVTGEDLQRRQAAELLSAAVDEIERLQRAAGAVTDGLTVARIKQHLRTPIPANEF